MVLARHSTLTNLTGVGSVVAARILADVGDVARVADRNRFASWTATAPVDASSGEQIRHRLSRAGNRLANHMFNIAAVSQIRLDTPGRPTTCAHPGTDDHRAQNAPTRPFQQREPLWPGGPQVDRFGRFSANFSSKGSSWSAGVKPKTAA